MPLTPEDVRNKRFTPVRLREGYDMGEVDQFLDEVEAELERLAKDNDDLRTQLAAASGAQPAALPVPSDEPSAAAQSAPITTVSQASGAAARLLELATRNADEVVAEAHEQSDKILAEARTTAEQVESDSRARAQQLDSETAERRQQLFGDLEKGRDDLVREVEQLRSFEREYRSRLKNYFAGQLSQLEGDETVAAPLPGSEAEPAPGGLRSLLGAADSEQPKQQ